MARVTLAAIMACAFCGMFGGFYAEAQAPPHHGPDGFRNNYPHDPARSFWLWKWEQLTQGVAEPPPGGWNTPFVRTDAERLRRNAGEATITWIGHAAFLLQLERMNVLIDPHFSERASPVQFAGPKRVVGLPIEIDELPPIDVVLVSHNHYDHLDLTTVRRLAARSPATLFLVPLGLKEWFRDAGIERVEEHDWWQERKVGALRFTLVPVQHWSKRTLWDTNRSLWGGWVIEGGGLKVIHTGDLGLSKDATDIGARLGPFDLALIPIGAYAPRWFMKTMHIDPGEAVKVRGELRAVRAIGMHWGTFEHLTDEPLDEPPQVLERERATAGLGPGDFDVMKVGETRSIAPRAAIRP